MKQKLDNYEKELIEGIIDKGNAKKSIRLRLKVNDLELLKHRADSEGLPQQTLLSSLVHKFVSDQLVDKRSIIKSLEILKTS